jgi:hypothetical protein
MKRDEIMENLVYAGIWFMLLLTPIISLLIRMSSDTSIQFSWNEVFDSWRLMLPFLVAFLLHNFIMARLLVYNNKVALYLCLTLAVAVLFQLYECQHRPQHLKEGDRPEWAVHPPHDLTHPTPDAELPMPDRGNPADAPDNPMHQPVTGEDHMQGPPPTNGMEKPPKMDKERRPPMDLHGPVIPLLGLLLMMGLNLGIKYYFKSRQETRKMEALQRAHLEQQLEYLKYQVNPHFFMNTLNNIHALVDIDPEQAKSTIL